jgi:hypothetical protein
MASCDSTLDPKYEKMTPMTRLFSRLRARARTLSNGNGAAPLSAPASRAARAGYVLTAAESAPCTCPEFCERDHEND